MVKPCNYKGLSLNKPKINRLLSLGHEGFGRGVIKYTNPEVMSKAGLLTFRVGIYGELEEGLKAKKTKTDGVFQS